MHSVNDIGNLKLISKEEIKKGIEVLNRYVGRCERLVGDVLEQLARTPLVQGIECKAAARMYYGCSRIAEEMIISYEQELAKR